MQQLYKCCFGCLDYLKGYVGCLDSLEGYFDNLFFGFGHFCKGNMTLNIVCKLFWLYRCFGRVLRQLVFWFCHFFKIGNVNHSFIYKRSFWL